MAPVEWPVAAPSDDPGRERARVAPRDRLPVVRADLFLHPGARLTEQERSLLTAMMADLIDSIADEFIVALGDCGPANDEGERVFDRLWQAGLLDMADLIRLLLRRADEERLATVINAGSAPGPARFVQSLVGDMDADVSAAAMALILARGRRRDRFDAPRIAFDDLCAEVAVGLVNAVAAALRPRVADRIGEGADDRLSAAARALLASHDEGKRLEARLFDLVHALDRADKLDEGFLSRALANGEVAIVGEALARRAGIGFEAAWDHLTGGDGQPALLLRMAGVSRQFAGELVAACADSIGSTAETEIAAFEALGDEEVERARNWIRLDPGYRSAVAALANGDGDRAF